MSVMCHLVLGLRTPLPGLMELLLHKQPWLCSAVEAVTPGTIRRDPGTEVACLGLNWRPAARLLFLGWVLCPQLEIPKVCSLPRFGGGRGGGTEGPLSHTSPRLTHAALAPWLPSHVP